MRKALLAAGAALALFGGAANAAVLTHHQTDRQGDFLAGFPKVDRPANGDLDLTDLTVSFDQAAAEFFVNVSVRDDITTQAGAFVIGIDTGKGARGPFGGVGEPNILFDQALTVQKDGSAVLGIVNPNGTPGTLALNAVMAPKGFSIGIKLADLKPTGLDPEHFGFSAWTKKGAVLADFAPNNKLLTAAGVPEPAAWAMFVGGFAVLGGSLRRRRASNARLLTV